MKTKWSHVGKLPLLLGRESALLARSEFLSGNVLPKLEPDKKYQVGILIGEKVIDPSHSIPPRSLYNFALPAIASRNRRV